MTGAVPLRLVGATVVAVVAAGCLVAVPTAHADPAADLGAAEQRAAVLRDQLDLLDAKAERAAERLAYARSQLADAALRSTGLEQRLDALSAGQDALQQETAAHVRDVYRMGGSLGMYGSVLAADSPADLAARYAAVQAVLSDDVAAVQTAGDRVDTAQAVHDQLDHLADQRAQLVVDVRRLADELAALENDARRAVRRADAQVRTLAEQLAEQRRTAAVAAAATSLADLGVTGNEPPGTPYARAAIDAALSVLGSPYVWGATGPDTFDCSGLMLWSYAKAGLVIPRVSRDQYQAATPVPLAQIRPGDFLVYAYDTSDPDTIHHITMYIGGGKMVHAPRTGDVVRVVPVYLDGLLGAARPG